MTLRLTSTSANPYRLFLVSALGWLLAPIPAFGEKWLTGRATYHGLDGYSIHGGELRAYRGSSRDEGDRPKCGNAAGCGVASPRCCGSRLS